MGYAPVKNGVYLSPSIRLLQSGSGWYMIDWDIQWNGPEITEGEVKRAIESLTSYIDLYHPSAATGPARYVEDHFRTAEEALTDLMRHKGGCSNWT